MHKIHYPRSVRDSIEEVEDPPDGQKNEDRFNTFYNYTEVKTDTRKYFDSYFVCPYAYVRALLYYIPVIILDSTFIKSRYGICLFVAAVKDFNNGTLPARSYAPAEYRRYGQITSNAVKSINSELLQIREYLPFDCLYRLYFLIMEKFAARRLRIHGPLEKPLTRYKQSLRERHLEEARELSVARSTDGEGSVFNAAFSKTYKVDLNTRSCTYRFYQENQFPYRHAFALSLRIGRIPNDRISPIEVNILRETEALPPRLEKRPGRPRKKRKERRNRIARRVYRCSQCGEPRHSSRTYQSPPNPFRGDGEDALSTTPPPTTPRRRLNIRKRQAARSRRAREALQHIREDSNVANGSSDLLSNINVAQASNSDLTSESGSNRSVYSD
ncbi:hypothetical protein B0J12DRAFT_692407 [Macrophomina phaseolina]|uniref:Uncharacterized protein n=1 Tax=Macrophomina phaseolina TaxID=35725 RepID=A0ABQ8FSC3_9PEZI|nr:hypothetical protein B0J12DRAFT_692407 [Macrophomina phaseolina]